MIQCIQHGPTSSPLVHLIALVEVNLSIVLLAEFLDSFKYVSLCPVLFFVDNPSLLYYVGMLLHASATPISVVQS